MPDCRDGVPADGTWIWFGARLLNKEQAITKQKIQFNLTVWFKSEVTTNHILTNVWQQTIMGWNWSDL